MTFWQFTVFLRATRRRLKEEYRERLTVAWHIEALARAKRMPRLKTFLSANLPQEDPENKVKTKIDEHAIVTRFKAHNKRIEKTK